MTERLGPLMLGITGTELLPEDCERLQHPAVGGVILFSRNYRDLAQLQALTAAIRELRKPDLLLAVDQEGGRVQRFVDDFTLLPALRRIGEVFAYDPVRGQALATDAGYVIACELASAGMDFSFAPVLDRDIGVSEVIGDRAFHDRPDVIAMLAGCFLDGLAAAGMRGIGKHFPGHGAVSADSHDELPVDPRAESEIESADVAAFLPVLPRLGGIMPAHVIYTAVDSLPAGYSRAWLGDRLRGRYGFGGAIFSDDLGMVGAHGMGDPAARTRAALAAGCDMALMCNDFPGMDEILQNLGDVVLSEESNARLLALHRQAVEIDSERLAQARERLHALSHHVENSGHFGEQSLVRE